ncbi:universal stress protein [Marinobacter subterrani]|uniref:Universal stress protein n=1 Tax=Marinobacter subterrani TaxID=1658765 RepID=A0A0J7LZB8_9GAMM|nr:universal stress protein [Marinobacter subterrani]KMQ74225.1 Nucleotide-binding universal stress protein, UspA family [Marinobacter subterrani]
MPAYKKMLVAIDLTEEAPQVLDKAKAVSEAHGAELVLVHVVEPVGYAYGGDIPMDLTELQDQLDKAAHEQLGNYGDQYGVAKTNQVVTVGRPESEIHRLAKEHNADLVIVGSHGRKGFQLLLGSTANGVLHGTECDVLAVRIHG